MTVAIYARVSSESQEARGTIGSQLDALRQKMVGLGHQVVHEYTDDGYSGARLDRPGSGRTARCRRSRPVQAGLVPDT